MTSKFIGPHLGGSWASNLEILRKWQPPLALVLSPDVDKVKQLRDACPNTIVIGRFFHDDSHYASNINARPKEFAAEIHQEISSNPVTPLLDYVQSNNEVCQDWQGIQKLNQYTQEWMHLADNSQVYKCAILAFSVGNPDLPYKPGDPAGFDGRMLYWQQVLPSLSYAQANDHILLLHAYGYPNMFSPDANWYLYRYERQVQANLKTLGITNLKYAYGEIGIDRLIVNGKGGYKVVTNDQDYVNQLLQWERDLQGESLLLGGAIFTFGDSGGWGTYDITSTNVANMIATHYADHAGDYGTPDTPSNEGETIFMPTVSTGTTSTTPSLPPRDIDPRLTARGVTIETPALAPGQAYWRIVKARWYDEQEADAIGPDHHILAEVLDSFGNRVGAGVSLLVEWPSDHTLIYTEAKPNDAWAANYPMTKSLNEFSISVNDGLAPSETFKGIGMGADGNSGIHTSTGVVFQLATMPQAAPPTTPEPPKPVPVDVIPLTATVITRKPSNIRSAPTFDDNVIDVAPIGTPYVVTGDAGEFYQIQHGDGAAYVHESVVSRTDVLPVPTQPSGDNWARSIAFVRRWEGGWADDPNDPGGATNKGITLGTFSRWREVQGQSTPSKDDLRALSDAEANRIYDLFYWRESGADKLPWPLCLAHFDTAVNAGTGRAQEMLQRSAGGFLAYMAHLIDWYTRIDNFEHFGRAWIRRRADILLEASK